MQNEMRDRLIELLEERRMQASEVLGSMNKGFGAWYADHLIDHGVTVQEWISVKDRLPEEGDYALCVLKGFNYGGKIQVCKFVPADKFKDKPYFEHFRNGFPSVTHWMPLPSAPKGE